MNCEKYTLLAAVGAVMTALFGGWDGAMVTLCLFLLGDYIAGVVLAAVFKRSKHTHTGALDSRAGLKGLCRKAGMMLMVMVAVRLDIMCGLGGMLRMGTIYALTANEALSIVENLGLMGVPLPEALSSAIERLRGRTGNTDGQEKSAQQKK